MDSPVLLIHVYCTDCNRVAGGLLGTMTEMQLKINNLSGDVFDMKCRVKSIEDGKFTDKMKQTAAAKATEVMKEVEKVNHRVSKIEKGNFTEEMNQVVAAKATKALSEVGEVKDRIDKLEEGENNRGDEEIFCRSTRASRGAGAGDEGAEKDRNETLTRAIMSQVNNKLSRQKNIVVFGVPEPGSNFKEEVTKRDRETVNQIIEHVKVKLENRSITTRRLGRKRSETEVDKNAGADDNKERENGEAQPEAKESNRPLLVQFETDSDKSSFMKNLYRLKGSKYNTISVKHDMTREEREQDKDMRSQSKEKTDSNMDPQVFYAVRGEPGERKVVKVLKK